MLVLYLHFDFGKGIKAVFFSSAVFWWITKGWRCMESVVWLPFSVLTLLVGWQGEYLASENHVIYLQTPCWTDGDEESRAIMLFVCIAAQYLLTNAVSSSAHQLTHTQPFYGSVDFFSETTRVSWYQRKHLPTHTYRGHHSSLIHFFHLLRSMASSLFNPRACQSFFTISLQVFFGLPLGQASSTSYSIHFFTQSLLSFLSTCPYYNWL